jgi:hypothetical protein
MTTTTPPARAATPARPITPRPLWERHQLFREPAYPEGLGPIEDDEDDNEAA